VAYGPEIAPSASSALEAVRLRSSIDIMLNRLFDAKPLQEQADEGGRGFDRDELETCSDEQMFYVLFGVPEGCCWCLPGRLRLGPLRTWTR